MCGYLLQCSTISRTSSRILLSEKASAAYPMDQNTTLQGR